MKSYYRFINAEINWFLAISTTIFLGKDKTNKKQDSVLQLKGTFYFDSRNPSNNYLIGEFNGFDFQKLADAFDYESAKTQKLVTGATFPNGARLTFTTNEGGESIVMILIVKLDIYTRIGQNNRSIDKMD